MAGLLKEEAYSRLLEMIYDGRFVYGKIYSLNAVSEELQMSKTPIRDAIQRLSNEGHIDLLPSRGFTLHEIDDNELLSRFHLSNAVEGYCAYALAAERKNGITSNGTLRLKDVVEQMKSLDLETVSFGEFTRLDNAFHNTILGAIEHVNFTKVFSIQSGFVNTPELHLTQSPISYAGILHFHERIMDAIWEGDPAGAYSAMLAHADAVLKSYIAAQRKDSRK